MSTSSKDFKVKNGLVVGGGGSFTDPVSVGTPTSGQHAATKDYVDSNSASLTISDSPPENPNPGDQWYNSGDGVTYVYYDGFWVESSSGGQETSLVGYATEAYVDSAISNAGGATESLTQIASGTFATGYAEHTFTGLSGYKKIIFNVVGVQAWAAPGSFWVNADYANGSYDNNNLAIINDNEYGFSAFAVMPYLTDIVSFGYADESKANGPAIYFIELDHCSAGGYTNINIDATFASNSAGGYGSGSIRIAGNSIYQETTAISSITLAQNFAAGSTYSIYGVA